VPLSLDDLERMVALDHGLAVVSVLRANGSIASSVVNAGLLQHPRTGERVVGFVAAGNARKLAHLRRDPRCTVVWRAGWRWAGTSGDAELAGPDDPLPDLDPAEVPKLLRAVFAGAGGTHDDWDEFDRVMAAERRAAVLIAPRHVFGVTG
jgi:PPOX class probable F420-dependent enzyme